MSPDILQESDQAIAGEIQDLADGRVEIPVNYVDGQILAFLVRAKEFAGVFAMDDIPAV